jgi:hypothetical protein
MYGALPPVLHMPTWHGVSSNTGQVYLYPYLEVTETQVTFKYVT